MPHLRQRLAWLLAGVILPFAPPAAPTASAGFAGFVPEPAGPAPDGSPGASASAHTVVHPLGPTAWCSAADFDGDARLGPAVLPDRGIVGRELRGYRRLGGMSESAFLSKFWNSMSNGWRYPPADGFLRDRYGRPKRHVLRLRVNLRVDRYGSEYGGFLAPFGELYARRSIPPQDLDDSQNPAGCNWHAYRVLRPFKVQAGPIAPAFAQPGHGTQYVLDGALVPGGPIRLTVLWLVDNGYLARLN
ncbi:DUF4237 domain-containing protein [Actinomadura logoneensis]|uniref:DUF4237 domain-containing protein n=1 Tax=Actinomadura logoneensis TaxID=2293572 RepID=A0A372JIT6_9ACTN|nr:TNT domain-containing protein [Actinomadura logoneensis]RFU39774.1 DUF4237 domain-containing protein [Actinomadura logoneensis]